jgi:glycosyltransferase involved in cell wall biosynthesis
VLLGIGSAISVKRPDRFLEWISALNALGIDVEARWLGDGPLRASLEANSIERSTSIKWCGHVTRSEIAAHLSEASLLLVTSEFEVMPLAVLEAYSAGVPVVTSKFDGVGDFVKQGETGLIVDPDSPENVAAEIRALLASDQWERMSLNARKTFNADFSDPRKMATQYEAIYSAVLSG